MKKLHDLKKSLPCNARLSSSEKTKTKGGSNYTAYGGDKRDKSAGKTNSLGLDPLFEG